MRNHSPDEAVHQHTYLIQQNEIAVPTAPPNRWTRLRAHIPVACFCSFIIAALTLVPQPWCFACEPLPLEPWGHTPSAADPYILLLTLVAAPSVAGFLRFPKSWLVPVSSILGLLLSQIAGGVPKWSLINNEGPFILIFVAPLVASLFLMALASRCLLQFLLSLRAPLTTSHAGSAFSPDPPPPAANSPASHAAPAATPSPSHHASHRSPTASPPPH